LLQRIRQFRVDLVAFSFYQEKDPMLEPMADDLATLALDLLVDEQGFQRSGPNFLLHPGSG
jgi:FdhE protein